MRYQHIIFLFSFMVLATCQIPPKAFPPEFDATKIGITESDIVYCTMNNVPLKMDIYYPTTIEKKWPVILYIHGGGWTQGDKNSVGSVVQIDKMRKAGILVVAAEYRLAPQYKFPAMIEDVKCAVRYMRAHAEKYNLNTERFGAIGGSAGGHLVALLGLTNKTAGFDVGEYTDYSSSVQAVVSISGLADLSPPFTTKLFFDRMDVFGTYDQHDPIFEQASPVNYTTSDGPPFLIIHGELDTTIPINQAIILDRHLKETGISTSLVKVKNADHTLLPISNKRIDPTMEEINNTIMLFWKKYLLK